MKTRKVIGSILIFLTVLLISIFTNCVQAESLGKVTITADRKVGNVTYRYQLHGDESSKKKNIWKLIACDDQGTAATPAVQDLYCLRAGLGFMTAENPDHKVVEYTTSFDMLSQYSELVTYYNSVNSISKIASDAETKKASFDAVLWILDNMLLESATDEEVKAYLKQYAEYTEEDFNNEDEEDKILSRADIEAVQQLAIWYFTNSDEEVYHEAILPSLYLNVKGDPLLDQTKFKEDSSKYLSMSEIYDGTGLLGASQYGTLRQAAADKLYKNLIKKAQEVTAGGTYKPKRKITIYLAGTGPTTEQPIVKVEDNQEVDVALRKFIKRARSRYKQLK